VIDYGNGTKVSNLSGTVSGPGIVRVYGNFTEFGSLSIWTGVTSLQSVSSWPSTLINLDGAFLGATNLTAVPATLPSTVRTVDSMFINTTIFNQNLSTWNVSNVTNMTAMFQGAGAFTAAGLNQWTPTSAIDMTRMFISTISAYTNTTSSGLFLTDLTSWPRSAVFDRFFCPDGSTDTSSTDPKSPFFGL
jgi:surface protein